jgi:hypothetical protein
MKQKEVFKKIGVIIKELNEQYDYLVSTEDALNELEIELFVANARFLADHSEVLQKLVLQNASAEKFVPVAAEKYFEPVAQKVLPAEVKSESSEKAPVPAPSAVNADENPVPHIDIRGDDTGSDYSYNREEPEVIRHQLLVDDISEWDNEPKESVHQKMAETIKEEAPVAEVPKPEPVKPAKQVEPVKPASQDAEEEPLTVNQRISAQLNSTASRATEHTVQPVTDLKKAITLNDKLLYIKELFNGYNLAYSEAIDILNRFDSFDEADKFLKNNYAVKNAWESKQAVADKFYDLLRRRYS